MTRVRGSDGLQHERAAQPERRLESRRSCSRRAFGEAGQERGLFVGQTSIELRLLAYVCLRKMGTVIRSNQL